MTRIGLILTPDNAADADFWRWCPPGASLHVARNEDRGQEALACVTASAFEASDEQVARSARSLRPISPAAVVFTCTSGSFGEGLAGERRIRRTVEGASATRALTASGAMLDALDAIGVRRLAVGTPYDASCTERLGSFLREAGLDLVSLERREPVEGAGLSDMTGPELVALARAANRPDADALFLSCTGLETYDLIGPLELELGKPVITATEATMWAVLGLTGVRPPVTGQKLFDHRWAASSRRLA